MSVQESPLWSTETSDHRQDLCSEFCTYTAQDLEEPMSVVHLQDWALSLFPSLLAGVNHYCTKAYSLIVLCHLSNQGDWAFLSLFSRNHLLGFIRDVKVVCTRSVLTSGYPSDKLQFPVHFTQTAHLHKWFLLWRQEGKNWHWSGHWTFAPDVGGVYIKIIKQSVCCSLVHTVPKSRWSDSLKFFTIGGLDGILCQGKSCGLSRDQFLPKVQWVCVGGGGLLRRQHGSSHRLGARSAFSRAA